MEALPLSFFCRPAEVVGPELMGCRLVKRQKDGSLLWGVIVETEAYAQDDPACHGYRRRSPQNETLFGEPGRFYVYVSCGIHQGDHAAHQLCLCGGVFDRKGHQRPPSREARQEVAVKWQQVRDGW